MFHLWLNIHEQYLPATVDDFNEAVLVVTVPAGVVAVRESGLAVDGIGIMGTGGHIACESASVISHDAMRGLTTLSLKLPALTHAEVQAMIARDDGAGAITSGDDAHPVPARGHYTEGARQERVAFMRNYTGLALPSLDQVGVPPESLKGNVENFVGSVEIPVGLAGPLLIHGSDFHDYVYAPLATTEGALVASASRGAKALSRSGGVFTRIMGQRMLRVPMFVLALREQAAEFVNWMRRAETGIRAQIRTVSKHAELTSLDFHVDANRVYVYFVYRTGDAAGQNMTTACTWQACQWILQTHKTRDMFDIREFYIESNMSGDKKANLQSLRAGRGTWVQAQCLVSRSVLQEVLNISPEKILTLYGAGRYSAEIVGMLGFNINIANTIAALYTATGQDIACVHESAVGELRLQPNRDASHIWVTMNLPALTIGTIGGGTHLHRQSDFLALMGCRGTGGRERLAQIIAAYSLALDLSTLAAVASGEFALAHERLGRNRPVNWLVPEELDASYFESCLQTHYRDPALQVSVVQDIQDSTGTSIVTELSARRSRRFLGLFGKQVTVRRPGLPAVTLPMIVKIKPLDREVLLTISGLAAAAGAEVSANIENFKERLGFLQCHSRELALYRLAHPSWRKYQPVIYHCHEDPQRELHAVIMERLEQVEMLNSLDHGLRWQDHHIHAAVDALADIHSVYLNEPQALMASDWLGYTATAADACAMKPLWIALATHAHREFPELYTAPDLDYALWCIATLENWWPAMERMPQTLIHNDFNPRNIAFRHVGDHGLTACVYDWELATIHVPQRDLMELLCFTLPVDSEITEVARYIELCRVLLEQRSTALLAGEEWWRGCIYAFRDFYINRIGMYLLAYSQHHYQFIPMLLAQARAIRKFDTEYLQFQH